MQAQVFFCFGPPFQNRGYDIVRWCVKKIAVHVNGKICKLICKYILFVNPTDRR